MSKRISEQTLFVAVGALLLALPLVALTNLEVIGRVIGSKAAYLGGAALPDSGVILNHDELTTGPGGKALVQFLPTTRATLSESTAVKFARQGSTYFGAIFSGSLVAEAPGAGTLVVETPRYKVEPASQSHTIFLVALMPNGNTVIAAKMAASQSRKSARA